MILFFYDDFIINNTLPTNYTFKIQIFTIPKEILIFINIIQNHQFILTIFYINLNMTKHYSLLII
jgi:hypothetical protein